MTGTTIPTEAEVLGYFDSLSNWGRWGADDELGALNFLTPRRCVRPRRWCATAARSRAPGP